MASAPAESDSTHQMANPARVPAWVHADFGAATHVGKVRSGNEDQYLVARLMKTLRVLASSLPGAVGMGDDIRFGRDRGFLMAVADGMGGAAAGERASALAVSGVEDFLLDSLKWFFHIGGAEQNILMREIRDGIAAVDRALFDQVYAEPRLSGMGTTLTLAFSVADDLYVAHVGDTRAYLFRDGLLEQITRDHTLAQLMVDRGLLTPEDARRDRRRNIITNVIGGPESGVRAEVHKLKLRDGDVILLCSDGLNDPVGDDEIADTLSLAATPDAACRALVDRALARGGPDNVTVVVGRYAVSDRPDPSAADNHAAISAFARLVELAQAGDPAEIGELRTRLLALGWRVDPSRPTG